MRTGATFGTEVAAGPSQVPVQAQAAHQSAWRSPIPYLFGGLAAMLGLIAFSLLILACSYWKLSGYLDSIEAETAAEGDGTEEAANGSKSRIDGGKPGKGVLERTILVIMAGEEKPTYLATPASSRGSSCAAVGGGDGGGCSSGEKAVELSERERTTPPRESTERTEGERGGGGGGDDQMRYGDTEDL
ncbi:hypothetical protein Dimus_025754 [Dionaea muscipula]